MFGLGFWEILLILVIVVVIFGARRIPGVARSLGQAAQEFKKGLDGKSCKGDDNKDGCSCGHENADKK